MITKEILMQKDNLIEDPLPYKHINKSLFVFLNINKQTQRMINYFKQSLHIGPNMSLQIFFAISPLSWKCIIFPPFLTFQIYL